MSQPYTRTRFTWIAYLLLALYGYLLNILGPVAPFLHDEFNLSYTVSSLHSSAFAAGILVVGLVGHWVIRPLGRERSLAVGALGLGIGALLLVLGRVPAVTIGATFLMGCVGSLILAVVPAALTEEHGEQGAVAISEANVLASTLATSAPILVGWLAHLAVGWRLALVVAALLALAIGIVLLRPGQARPARIQRETGGGRLPALYWYYWLALVLAVSAEFCMVLWSADYLERQLGMPKAGASTSVSLFLGGMILGRLAGSQVLRRFSARALVLGSVLLAGAGFLVFWQAPGALVGQVGLAVTGLGIASLYPTIISMAIGASKGQEGLAGARATLASGTAILLLPLVLGRLADLVGLKTAYALVVLLLAALLLMILGRQSAASPAEISTERTP